MAQERVTKVGIQLKPIIPIQLFDAGSQEKTQNTIEFTNSPQVSMGFGMVVRKGFTKSLSIEMGLSYLKRNFDLTIVDADSSITSESSFRLVNYEIPVLGLVNVQLNRNMFMTVAGGLSVDFYPTPLFTYSDLFTSAVNRSNWVQTALLANVGWEYRTEKSGTLYFGASLHRAFNTIMTEFVSYNGRELPVETSFELTGNYLTIDLRYFFHAEKEKKKVKKKKKEKRVFIDPRK